MDKLRDLSKAFVVFGAVIALTVLVAACGSSGSSSSGGGSTEAGGEEAAAGNAEDASSEEGGKASIDLGTTTLEVEKKVPKIGFFAYGLSAYELSYKAEIEKMDKEGSDVTWIEAKFDASTQLKQLETALSTGEYEAWILEAVDAEGVCNMVSRQAPEKEIPVSIMVTPTCGRSEKPWGEEVWAPGTLNFVSDTANVTWLTHVFEAQKEILEIGPETKVAFINGPDIAAQAKAVGAAVEAAGIEPVETVAGDYTAPTAQKLTQGILSRNPEIEVIIDGYEGATPGIIAALKEAGKSAGEVKVGDVGGSKEITVPNVKSGWLQVSAAYDPKVTARIAIEEMEAAFDGEQGPRFLPADPPGASLTEPLMITKENVGEFEPTY
ncbi:MAG: sugar ABC transporter substrate-binding protein [Solirubrobacterales bacterium]